MKPRYAQLPKTSQPCPACLLCGRHGCFLSWHVMTDILWCRRCGYKITAQLWLTRGRSISG